MPNTYKSGNHSKYLLQDHLIFVCKYRKKLLVNQNVIADVKALSTEICKKHSVNVVRHIIETKTLLKTSYKKARKFLQKARLLNN